MGIFPPCNSSEIVEKLLGSVCGKIKDEPKIETKKMRATVVLQKKNVMDVTDLGASIVDRFYELFRRGISLQLISAHHFDPGEFISLSLLSRFELHFLTFSLIRMRVCVCFG